jgi:L1 cell adhesion molecule like protein
MSGIIIGIDLGTTNSCVGVWQNNSVEIIPNLQGNKTTPSYVSFDPKTGKRLIGEPARRQAHINPKNTVFDVKRLMGRHFSEIECDLENYPYTIVPDSNGLPLIQINIGDGDQLRTIRYKPEEISAFILSYMKECAENYLNEPVKKAVITVPAYFNDYQRQATKDASAIANLECVRIINEPTAGCLCYGLHGKGTLNKTEDLHILVYDLGGGTLDVSVLNLDGGVFQVLSTCGDTRIGGEDIDWLLVEYVAKEANLGLTGREDPRLKRLQLACEQAKRELSSADSTTVDTGSSVVTITRPQFENLIEPLLIRAFKPVKTVLKDAGLEPERIDEIVLVGGSTRIPIIQSRLSQMFGNKRLNKSVNPDEAVAYGATVQSAILSDDSVGSRVKDLVLLDVTPLSLGIETVGGVMSRIIERNSPIPCQQSKMFSTAEDNQESVLVQVFEGERKFTADNHRLGTFELGPILLGPRGIPKIQVTFAIDSNGILQVSAMDKNTGLGTDAKLTPESGRLTAEEIQAMIRSAESNKLADDRRQACLEEYTMFERYLFSVQQAVNDDAINDSLTEEERSFVNQYLINSFKWINDNRADNESSAESIRQAMQAVEYNLKPLMTRMYEH